MALELPALAAALDCQLSAASIADVGLLMRAVESVDRHLDPLACSRQRRQLAAQVVAQLESASGAAVDLPAEVAADLGALVGALAQRGVCDRFAPLACEVFANAEAMRHTRSIRDYVRRAVREGELLVELTLLLVREPAPRLQLFLRRVAASANLLDKLSDGVDDYRNGELAIVPGVRFHCALAGALALGLPPALALSLRPRSMTALASWAVRLLRVHVSGARLLDPRATR